MASADRNLGSLVLGSNGTYTYSVANSATQFLGATDIKVDTFTVTSFDGTTAGPALMCTRLLLHCRFAGIDPNDRGNDAATAL